MASGYAILTQYEGREGSPVVLYNDLSLRSAERHMAAIRRVREEAGEAIADELDGFTVETRYGPRRYWIVDQQSS